MEKATIQSLIVNPKKTLDSATKRQLQSLIEDEFKQKQTMFDSAVNEEKRKFMEKYKKSVGFDKLLAQYNKKLHETNEAQRAMNATGLDDKGEFLSFTWHDREDLHKREIIKNVENLKQTIEGLSNRNPDQLKTKIIARLWVSSTIGEAVVIINEVMGNGVIPSLTTKQLTYQEEK